MNEKKKKTSWLKKMVCFVKNKQKQEKEWYLIKYSFLFRATYFHYLNQILKRDRFKVDLPDFYYQMGWVIKPEALLLTRLAMANVRKQGVKHINQSFKKLMLS